MAVEAAEPRAFEDRLGQEQPVGDDDGDVGIQSAANAACSACALQRYGRRAPRCRAARPRAAPATASVPARAGRPAAAAACRRRRSHARPRRSRASVGTENSGVPMKMMRSGIADSAGQALSRFARSNGFTSFRSSLTPRMRLPDHPARRAILGELLELLHHHVALQLRDVVDEQHAVQMVDLVLQAGGEQAVGFDLLRLAVAVEILDPDRGRPLDLGIIVRDRQAAFLVDRALVAELSRTSGLMKTCGAGGSPSLARSMTSMRSGSPTWIAARPMPGASYMVSSMSSASFSSGASTRSTGLETWRRTGSGRMMSGLIDMRLT